MPSISIFRKDEAALIDHFAELIETARTEYRPVLTDFTDPRQRLIATSLVSADDDIKLVHFGGYPHAERQRIIFAPSYFQQRRLILIFGCYRSFIRRNSPNCTIVQCKAPY